MVREKHYIAKQETSTDDKHFSGTITATYAITRKGTVYIDNISFEQPQKRRAGNSIINRLKSISGQTI